ncbi:MAG: alpha/beta hydrolase [Rhodopila sp.]
MNAALPRTITMTLPRTITMTLPGSGTQASLVLPQGRAQGLIVFAHGAGARVVPHNLHIAAALQQAGFATLLFALLTEAEAANRSNAFNIPLLAQRLDEAATSGRLAAANLQLPLGFFGDGAGAAAALAAASVRADVAAVVSCGGRADLAGAALTAVAAATLLIAGSGDPAMLALNQEAYQMLRCERRLDIISGATHLFEEPGVLDAVVSLAKEWFLTHLAMPAAEMECNVR